MAKLMTNMAVMIHMKRLTSRARPERSFTGGVADEAEPETAGDAVGQRHHDDGHEGREAFGKVIEVDVHHFHHHERAHDEQRRSRGESGHKADERGDTREAANRTATVNAVRPVRPPAKCPRRFPHSW